eukprot:5593274-Prymnesium_polylepis.1
MQHPHSIRLTAPPTTSVARRHGQQLQWQRGCVRAVRFHSAGATAGAAGRPGVAAASSGPAAATASSDRAAPT